MTVFTRRTHVDGRPNQEKKERDKQNNNFARALHFLVHFAAVISRLRRGNTWFHVLWRT